MHAAWYLLAGFAVGVAGVVLAVVSDRGGAPWPLVSLGYALAVLGPLLFWVALPLRHALRRRPGDRP